jgi:regulation of enolase protein 1 (concanavalin A-like superfamily)
MKLASLPIGTVSFTDRSADLVNDRPETYGIAAVFVGPGGRAVEGPRATVHATPAPAPPGWTGSSINEGSVTGSVHFDAAAGLLTLRGSGTDIWNTADEFYFLSQPVAGDFRITVKALTRPTETDVWAKAGLMLRASLEPGSRDAYLVTTPRNGLNFQWRRGDDEECDTHDVIASPALKLPMVLRLTRRGDTITPEYSRDDGRHFQSAGAPLTLEETLPPTIYTGLSITSHNPGQITEAKFRDLRVEALGR